MSTLGALSVQALPNLTPGQWIILVVMLVAFLCIPFWQYMFRVRLSTWRYHRSRRTSKADLQMSASALRIEILHALGILNPIVAGLVTLYGQPPWKGTIVTVCLVFFPVRLLVEIVLSYLGYRTSRRALDAEELAAIQAASIAAIEKPAGAIDIPPPSYPTSGGENGP